MLVAQGHPLDRIYDPGHADADSQDLPVVIRADSLDGVLDLSQDALHRLGGVNGIVKLFERTLGEIYRCGHDTPRLEIHPDKAATLRVERQEGRRPARFRCGPLAFVEVSVLDQVIYIDSHRRRRQVHGPRQLHAREPVPRAHAQEQVRLLDSDRIALDLKAPRRPGNPGW